MTSKNKASQGHTAGYGQLTLSLTTPVLTIAQQASRPDRETRLTAAQAVLSRGLAGVRDDPKALADYLAFAARFHDYSPRNTLLIYMQRPTARFCKGFRSWTQVGRRVRAGERGLMVYAPILKRPTQAEIAAGASADERSGATRTSTIAKSGGRGRAGGLPPSRMSMQLQNLFS